MKIKMKVFFILWGLPLFFFISDAMGDDFNNSVEAGKQIFKEKCSVCHKITDQKLVGPGLQGVLERRDEIWVDKWLQSPEKFIKSGDKTAVELKKGYFRVMPTLPEMQDPVNRKEIIKYLKTLRGGGEP